jgi:hypothetical protein
MYASIQRRHLDVAHSFRTLAAASAAVLFVGWTIMLAYEIVKWGSWLPKSHSYDQAIVLAVLFASYAIGWRHELAGAALTLIAMIAFYAIGYHSTETFPSRAAMLLSTPGVFYLMAWVCNGRRHVTHSE